jgi:SpoVK/Ycf46/Vps4 family AAA+-type ATPase
LDGLVGKSSDAYVLTIASTNVPWMLDKAILSRFQKKVLIPLPDAPARDDILRHHLERRGLESEVSYADLAALTGGYSGRELAGVCQEVVNKIILSSNPDVSHLVDKGMEAIKEYTLRLRPITLADFEAGLDGIRPGTSAADIHAYDSWIKQQE